MLVVREKQDLRFLAKLSQHLETCCGASVIKVYQQIVGDEGKRMRAADGDKRQAPAVMLNHQRWPARNSQRLREFEVIEAQEFNLTGTKLLCILRKGTLRRSQYNESCDSGDEAQVSFKDWLLADLELPKGIKRPVVEAEHPWWRVMCLTGVDYFSTLGYQSGIAFLAAGVLSPIATLVLVLVTLFAALPVYRRVAAASPNGQGSIAMLERLFPGWGGKVFVLVLLGFASTDFVITMTLSAADATAHFIHNPYTPHFLQNQMAVTLFLLAVLGGIFLKGFREAINLAVWLVAVYLALNSVVTIAGVLQILQHPEVLPAWKTRTLYPARKYPFYFRTVAPFVSPPCTGPLRV
jgi:hypothetical protein